MPVKLGCISGLCVGGGDGIMEAMHRSLKLPLRTLLLPGFTGGILSLVAGMTGTVAAGLFMLAARPQGRGHDAGAEDMQEEAL